jgi:hypothetical protein
MSTALLRPVGSLSDLAHWSLRSSQGRQLLATTSPEVNQELVAWLARMFHELMSRDRENGGATGQPQGVGSEAYLTGASQGPAPEDARLPSCRAYNSERRTARSVVAASDS